MILIIMIDNYFKRWLGKKGLPKDRWVNKKGLKHLIHLAHFYQYQKAVTLI